MPVHVVRLRRWLAAAAIVLLVIVAGVYLYGRWRVYRTVRNLPSQLGINIQQSTQGFSLSKSEGGRTIFTIRASQATQYKPGGRAELRGVHILVYGRRANRFDQIYGERFDYDPQSGNVSAMGEVHMDLEGNAEGPLSPDQAPPAELKNPIHIKTSGLVFNQKTGVASTQEWIEFRVPQASGSAQGATYDSRAATLTLEKNLQVQATGPHAAKIEARQGMITRGPNRAILQEVRVQRASGSLHADELTIFLRDDNSVERLAAAGNVEASSQGESRVLARAPRADAWITERNALRSAELSGGVTFESSGQKNMSGNAGRVTMNFAAGNKLEKVAASQNVHLVQLPGGTLTAQAHRVEIAAPEINFILHNGRVLEQAVTCGPGEVTIAPVSGSQEKTVVTAGQFNAEFDSRSRLRRAVGSSNVKVVAASPGNPDKVSTSEKLDVTFAPDGGITALEQSGHFEYHEAAANSGGSGRAAFAQVAGYTPADDTLLLSGAPRVVQDGVTTTAESIRLKRRAGEARAEGDVKTTYTQLQQKPGGALLATADPIHVTAGRMIATQSGGVATYYGVPTGGRARATARLWQGGNVVEAPVIEFYRDQRTLVARSNPMSGSRANPGPAHDVSTVFVQRDQSGKLTPVNVSAARLSYVDSERRARFEGGVVVRAANATVTAGQVDVLLQPRVQTPASGNVGSGTEQAGIPGPSQLDRIVATGNVTVQEAKRRATGDKLVYVAEDARFVLTGGPPSIFDAERGKITGNSLTFFSRDDRVLVEGGSSSPAVTRTRVAK